MNPQLYAVAVGTFLMLNLLFAALEGAVTETSVSNPNASLISASLFSEQSLPWPLNSVQYPLPSGSYFILLFNALTWNHAMFNYNEWTQIIRTPFLIVSGAVLWGILRVFVPIIINAVALLRRLSPI